MSTDDTRPLPQVSPSDPGTSAPSPADIPTTALTVEEIAAAIAGEEAGDPTQVLGSPATAKAAVTEELTQVAAPSEPWSAPSADEETAVVDPITAIRSSQAWPTQALASSHSARSAGSAGSARSAASPASAGVAGAAAKTQDPGKPQAEEPELWSGSTLSREPEEARDHTPKGLRISTLLWGTLLAAMGVLLVAMGMGNHVDAVTIAVLLLIAAGSAMFIAALVPARSRS